MKGLLQSTTPGMQGKIRNVRIPTFFPYEGVNSNKQDVANHKHNLQDDVTGKYPLHSHILGMLTHKTTWDQHWGGDEKLK